MLGRRVRALLGPHGFGLVAVAVANSGGTTYAGFGATEATPFEIGSIGKAFTGMLLADLVEAGEFSLSQPVGELVPGSLLADCPATLQELSQHRSGLPRLPVNVGFLAPALIGQILGRNPYRESAEAVLDLAGRARATGGGPPVYSNLGAATLGDALAAHTGRSYSGLFTDRILNPLGLTSTSVVTRAGDLPVGRADGRSASRGWRTTPWMAEGWAPAGVGLWSTAADLARLARTILEGTAPGARAAEPTRDFTPGRRIGLGWITSQANGLEITWHNGGTGGFSSFIGVCREHGRAVAVLAASTASVDHVAVDLLTTDN